MAKKLTSSKAEEMLHNPPHGKPLTDKQRKFFGAIAGGAKAYATDGWLSKYEDGGEYLGTTNRGFDYNGAWGGPSMAMGGSLPSLTGMMYERTGAPSKGPRRNQTDVTDASAQNGQEMKFYQEGLDWKPRNISKNGSVIKDDRGQWAHPGEITEIQGDTMATHGYGDIPLWVEPDVGEPRLINPNTGTHKFPGAKKFKETPVKKNWLEKYK